MNGVDTGKCAGLAHKFGIDRQFCDDPEIGSPLGFQVSLGD